MTGRCFFLGPIAANGNTATLFGMSSQGMRGSDPIGHYPPASLAVLIRDRGPEHKVEERDGEVIVWKVPGASWPVRLRRVTERREWHAVAVPSRPMKANRAVILDAIEFEVRTLADLELVERRARYGHGNEA